MSELLNQSPPSASQMGFFRVPLVCEAAPHIGCGTRARPVLAEAEQASAVREAWLNRDGTILGVVWTDTADPIQLRQALSRHGIAAVELQEEERRLAYNSFAGNSGWYRPSQMQALSIEEARVIAARILRRLARDTALPIATTEHLRRETERACARTLAEASAVSASMRREQIASALMEAARRILEPEALPAFQAAVSLGHRPLPGET